MKTSSNNFDYIGKFQENLTNVQTFHKCSKLVLTIFVETEDGVGDEICICSLKKACTLTSGTFLCTGEASQQTPVKSLFLSCCIGCRCPDFGSSVAEGVVSVRSSQWLPYVGHS